MFLPETATCLTAYHQDGFLPDGLPETAVFLDGYSPDGCLSGGCLSGGYSPGGYSPDGCLSDGLPDGSVRIGGSNRGAEGFQSGEACGRWDETGVHRAEGDINQRNIFCCESEKLSLFAAQ